MTSRLTGPNAWLNAGPRNPGAQSDVTAAPPTDGPASSRITDRLVLARTAAATSPLRPPPITMTSVTRRGLPLPSLVRGTSSRRTPYRRRSRGPVAPLRSGGARRTSRFCQSCDTISHHFHRSVASGRGHDAATGMCRRSAHVEPPDRRPVSGPARCRPQKEQLFQCQLALKNVAF